MTTTSAVPSAALTAHLASQRSAVRRALTCLLADLPTPALTAIVGADGTAQHYYRDAMGVVVTWPAHAPDQPSTVDLATLAIPALAALTEPRWVGPAAIQQYAARFQAPSTLQRRQASGRADRAAADA